LRVCPASWFVPHLRRGLAPTDTLRVVLQSGFSEYPSLTLANDLFDLNRACFTQLGKTCEKWYRAKAEIIVKLRRTRSFYCLSAAGERTRKSSFPKPRP
jgi:hypothetical protein